MFPTHTNTAISQLQLNAALHKAPHKNNLSCEVTERHANKNITLGYAGGSVTHNIGQCHKLVKLSYDI